MIIRAAKAARPSKPSPALPRSGGPEIRKHDCAPTFYWELDARFEVEHPIALKDEGYLANGLRWGSTLIDTHAEYGACPPRVCVPPVDLDELVYSDAVAAILQVAE